MVTSSMLPLWPSRIIQNSNKFGLKRCFLGVVNLAPTTCVGMLYYQKGKFRFFSVQNLFENIARIANAVPFTMNDEIVFLNCQKCNQQRLTGHKSLGSFIQGVLSMSLS